MKGCPLGSKGGRCWDRQLQRLSVATASVLERAGLQREMGKELPLPQNEPKRKAFVLGNLNVHIIPLM